MSLKAFLFKISRSKGGGVIGRWAYILCSGFVSLVFRLTTEIRSVYLAGSMSNGDIAPGLSDIDFVIVIKDLSALDEYRLINRLETKLRYLLPPFGKDKLGTHVLIYSAGEWALVGDLFSGKSYGRPRKLFQKDEMIYSHTFGRIVKGLHHFYKAHWRLEAIQQNLGYQADNGLERALRERVLERSFQSIENGFREARKDEETPAPYVSLRNEIRKLMSKTDKTDSLYEMILIRLLHFFDISAGICFPDSPQEEREDITMKAPVNMESEKHRSKEFMTGVPEAIEREVRTHSILFSRMMYDDVYLYDPAYYKTSEKLIGYYSGKRERSLRVMSRDRFEKFCLTLPEDSVRFIDIRNGEPLTLTGKLCTDGLLIRTYAIFPQLRCPRNLEDYGRYESFRNNAERLVRGFEVANIREPAYEALQAAVVKENAMNRDEKSVYDRYLDLRALSEALRNNLMEFLSSDHEN
ncbi:MAG: nucleotidyltransferase domain-containing protein [Thermodesulfobacteriota bacterium]